MTLAQFVAAAIVFFGAGGAFLLKKAYSEWIPNLIETKLDEAKITSQIRLNERKSDLDDKANLWKTIDVANKEMMKRQDYYERLAAKYDKLAEKYDLLFEENRQIAQHTIDVMNVYGEGIKARNSIQQEHLVQMGALSKQLTEQDGSLKQILANFIEVENGRKSAVDRVIDRINKLGLDIPEILRPQFEKATKIILEGLDQGNSQNEIPTS